MSSPMRLSSQPQAHAVESGSCRISTRGELQALEYRDLVGQLRVARILEADLTVLLGDLLHQLRGECAQLVGIKGVQVDRGVHPASVPETLVIRGKLTYGCREIRSHGSRGRLRRSARAGP